MSNGFELWLFVVAMGTSVLGGMLGMASGIFIVPILTLFGGVGLHTAVAASLVSVIACSCGGAAPFLRARLTNVRLAIVLEVATTMGALTGVFLAGVLSISFLYGLFTVILLLSALQMLGRRKDPAGLQLEAPASSWASQLQLHAAYPGSKDTQDIPYYVHRLPLGMSFMYAAGLVSALLGIGSGVLKIPAMDSVLKLPIKVSSATSNFMIGVTAAASAGVYFVRGDIVPAIAGPVALGSVLGALVGAKILLRLSGDWLRLLFVAVLVALAVQMGMSAFGIHVAGLHSSAVMHFLERVVA
jgi:uncharacterized membrane protein YfcA